MGEFHELEALLAKAKRADPNDRIALRDPIAAHGIAAIEAISPWLRDRSLGAFAVRVIERAAGSVGAEAAVRALRREEPAAASPSVSSDIADAVSRLTGAKPGTPARLERFAVYAIPPQAGAGWPGFKPRDFEGIAGTQWRSKDGPRSLAPLLVRSLRYRHPHLESFGVERLPELHMALSDRYRLGGERESGWRAAKLVVYANGPRAEAPDIRREVVAGLYVEKGDLESASRFGIVDERLWDWPWFVRALRDTHLQAELAAAMARHGLSVGDYIGGSFGPDGDRLGFAGGLERGQLIVRDRHGSQVVSGFDQLADLLEALPETRWHSLHIWRTWPADDAIAAGAGFANELLPVLNDLFDVYLDIVMPAMEGRAVSAGTTD